MLPSTRPHVLLVDDDPPVLDGLCRQLRGRCDVTAACDAAQALDVLADERDVAVIVSDLRMPGMDGTALLARARELRPEATRVLLTGHADAEAAAAAVNDGHIFRFLWKPCDRETLTQALEDAVAQHRLVTAEKELLEETLRGSVDALLETLALANPIAFARAQRIKGIVKDILDRLDVPNRWEVEIAAMLSQLGAVILPPVTAERLHAGRPLDHDERDMVAGLPEIADELLAGIPRLENVRAIIRGHTFSLLTDEIPIGARILRVAVAYDALEAGGLPAPVTVDRLGAAAGQQGYDPTVLAALRRADSHLGSVVHVRIDELRPGMVLESDLRRPDGVLLVGRGHTVTEPLIERIRNFGNAMPLDPIVSARVRTAEQPKTGVRS